MKHLSMNCITRSAALAGALLMGTSLAGTGAWAQWQPTDNVEFIVPAGTGGGADQMARMIQGIVTSHGLMEQSMVVINRGGGAGAEGFMDVVQDAGNPHKIIITLSNLFTTPLATGVPFSYEDMTPVSMLALDNFILWVNADTEYQTATDYLEAASQPDASMQMGGTGSRQEDQIITAAIESATDAEFTYIPFDGGGDVAVAVVGGHIDSSVNNPIEQVSHWQGGSTRPLCVFAAERLQVEGSDIAWGDIPTCEEAGVPTQYQMLRGIFMPADVEQEVVDYYVDLFAQVRETPEWQDFMKSGAFTQTSMSGEEYAAWIAETAQMHEKLMTEAGFTAESN